MTREGAIKSKSKRLAWLLRHGAVESGLVTDEAGFAAVDDVLALLRLDRDELLAVVSENDKRRYELSPEGDRVRACQGHSLAGTLVTLDGLEATWREVTDDVVLFHGTSVAFARSIVREGISPSARTHVHLAESEDARVGKRANVDVLLAVSTDALRDEGLRVFRAGNGVLLARRVPRSAIVDVTPRNRPGQRAHAELLALLRSP